MKTWVVARLVRDKKYDGYVHVSAKNSDTDHSIVLCAKRVSRGAQSISSPLHARAHHAHTLTTCDKPNMFATSMSCLLVSDASCELVQRILDYCNTKPTTCRPLFPEAILDSGVLLPEIGHQTIGDGRTGQRLPVGDRYKVLPACGVHFNHISSHQGAKDFPAVSESIIRL